MFSLASARTSVDAPRGKSSSGPLTEELRGIVVPLTRVPRTPKRPLPRSASCFRSEKSTVNSTRTQGWLGHMIGASSVTKPRGFHSLTFVQESDDGKFIYGGCVATLRQPSNTNYLQNLGVSPSYSHSFSAPAAVTSGKTSPSSCRLLLCRLLPPRCRKIAYANVPIQPHRNGA